MAQLRWSVLCERVITDQPPRGVVSLIDVLEEIRLPPPPADIDPKQRPLVPLRFSLVNYWARTKRERPESAKARVRIFAPDRQQLSSTEFPVDLTVASQVRTVISSPGFPLHGEGDYEVVTEVASGTRWRAVSKQYFRLIYVDDVRKKPIRH